MRRPAETLKRIQKEKAICNLGIFIKMKSYVAPSAWMKAVSIACPQSIAIPASDTRRRKHSTRCPKLGPGPSKCNIAEFISLLRSASAQTAMGAHPTRSPCHPCTFVTVISTMGTQRLPESCCPINRRWYHATWLWRPSFSLSRKRATLWRAIRRALSKLAIRHVLVAVTLRE